MIRWLAELRAENHTSLYRIGREGDRRIAAWPGLATLSCDLDGSNVQFANVDGAAPSIVEKIEHGLARALVRSLRADGGITLHASGFAAEGRAVLCSGASGEGKSTLAHAVCTRDTSARLVADDMAPLDVTAERVLCLPSEGAVRLWDDADSLVKASFVHPELVGDAPLGALVCLTFDDARAATGTVASVASAGLAVPPRLERLPQIALLARLLPAVVRFALDDPEAHARELATLGRLCRLVPGYELRRPRDLTALPSTADLVLELARGAANVANRTDASR